MQKVSEFMEHLGQEHKFALQLHALHADDRAWVLSQLSVATQAYFKPMLEELEALGLQIAAQDIPAILASPSSSYDAADMDKADGPALVIHRATAAQIDFLFEDEPPAFLASLKSLAAWPWSAGTSDLHSRKFMTGDLDGALTLTVAAQAVLLAVVAAQLPDSPPSSGMTKQSSTTPLLPDLIKKVFRWGR
ncbi:hypothetical protein ED236_09235 [Pseudomethylobacillus aquaticus]|uniref:Uncharacterized protein n=1 Tax=Pseudomethylobacillus aquaticus TaxID=2676064 RepID=A0A3N0UZG8_9PROT|nr:hypothetical protein [Pseudomethylobacillus aquaticus]ROH85903.1 hypothetical protein ED236_09235 [Pseudomethylobacillus aquaticus]